MKTLLLFLLVGWSLLPSAGHAQGRYLTKKGEVSFFSSSPIEDIEARNQQAAAMLDLSTGQLAFSLPIKGFVFKSTLMQEHFNENYLESDKYPKSTFVGRLMGFDAAVLNTPGPHPVQVEGQLTIHGVTQNVKVPGTLELRNNQLLAAATFPVAPADYKIEIPLLVRDHLAKVMSVRVALACTPAPAAKSSN